MIYKCNLANLPYIFLKLEELHLDLLFTTDFFLHLFHLFKFVSLTVEGEHSSPWRGICSVTFDIEDDLRPAVSCDLVDDPTEQRKEPEQSQIGIKTQTSLEGEGDTFAQQEQSTPGADEADSTGEGDVEENEKELEAGISEDFQESPGVSEVDMVEEKEEHQTAHRSDSEFDDPSGSVKSGTPSSQPKQNEQEDEETTEDNTEKSCLAAQKRESRCLLYLKVLHVVL